MTGGVFTQRDTAKNMSVEENTINVTANENAQMGYLARGVDSFYHNNVNITAPMGAMFGECVRVDENTIKVDNSDFRNYIKDHVSEEEYSYFSVYAWRDDVPDVVSFTGNKITFNEQMFEYQDVRIVSCKRCQHERYGAQYVRRRRRGNRRGRGRQQAHALNHGMPGHRRNVSGLRAAQTTVRSLTPST